MTTPHVLRNYSAKTGKGYCLGCKGITNVTLIGKQYRCQWDKDYSAPIPKTIKPKKIAGDKLAAKTRALSAKVTRIETTYNMSFYDYLSLLDSASYACPICLSAFTTANPPHIDHNHACCPGKASCGQCVRGLLCRLCNTGIGYFRDSTDSLVRAYEYLLDNTN
jgi:hypothetical protein